METSKQNSENLNQEMDVLMKPPNMIAVDGPAASGKSTIAEKLAERLNYLFFDTGVMYRAVTWAAIDRFGRTDIEAAVSELARTIQIDVRPASKSDGRKTDVLVDNRDVTWEIRGPEVDANVSQVSTYPEVRAALTDQQRRIGLQGKVVMAGRDIGTVVLPEAELKIYLDASAEVRANRRYSEILRRGGSASYDDILTALRRRDEIDSTRAIAPLRPSDDAIIIHTDGLCIEDVLMKILAYIS
jgi:CMP/dCMP kinase